MIVDHGGRAGRHADDGEHPPPDASGWIAVLLLAALVIAAAWAWRAWRG
jgi:hypothetical protein